RPPLRAVAVPLLLAALAPPAAPQAVPGAGLGIGPGGTPSMAEVVLRSAERSRRENDRRRERGVIQTGIGPYTVTQVDIPATDPGDGFFTGTGFLERIQVMTPYGFDADGPDVPLIVAFNGWGLSANSFFNGMSTIPDEANVRGWMVVAVTCLDDKSYGWIVGQTGIEVALEYVDHHYPIDRDRIYGVGWSGGGGSVASYAARHRDPTAPMFAAIATNAGTYDLEDTWFWVPSSTKQIMEHPNLFQGPPSGATLYNYERTQTQSLLAGAVDLPRAQLRNLLHTPVRHVFSTDDTLPYLAAQSAHFRDAFLADGTAYSWQSFSGLPEPHTWDLLPGPATLDYFEPRTLQTDVGAFHVTADRKGRYDWATVFLQGGGDFATFECALDEAANGVVVTGVSNVTALVLEPPPTRVALGTDFSLTFSTADAAPTLVRLKRVTAAPDALTVGGAPFAAWTYDGATDELTITAPPGATTFDVAFDDTSLLLKGPATVGKSPDVHLDLAGGQAGQEYVLLLGLAEAETPLTTFDPADPRDLLVALSPLPVLLPGTLDPNGEDAIDFCVPPTLAGQSIFGQFVTLPGQTTIVDALSNRLRIDVVAP
ncbi:MAG: hypothetical protein ACF8XB_12680, partial [Planctomycetota bacterium JB042]